MNTILQYDVTDMQVSHNDDGTLHVVFTVPDCPAQRPSGEKKASLVSSVAHEHGKQRTNTTSLRTMSIRGDLIFIEALSAREQEVLEVLAQGASNQEIADALVIAPNTVKRHVQAILAKLGVSNRTQAVARAQHLGLLVQKSTKAS